jgi:hypothetical protein
MDMGMGIIRTATGPLILTAPTTAAIDMVAILIGAEVTGAIRAIMATIGRIAGITIADGGEACRMFAAPDVAISAE